MGLDGYCHNLASALTTQALQIVHGSDSPKSWANFPTQTMAFAFIERNAETTFTISKTTQVRFEIHLLYSLEKVLACDDDHSLVIAVHHLELSICFASVVTGSTLFSGRLPTVLPAL